MFEITEYIGIIAFSISGFFIGVRYKLDTLGVFTSVFLTAFGGGIIRDIIVNKIPYIFIHGIFGIIILTIVWLFILLKLHKQKCIKDKLIFIIFDAIGLVSFSITGAKIAIENNLNLTGVLVLSFITSVGGGIIRDVIINEVPFVFRTGFYGTISLLIGFVMYALKFFDILSFCTSVAVLLFGVVIRIFAYYKKWSIPLS
jgi:uncharacterized membrane protein YeiH